MKNKQVLALVKKLKTEVQKGFGRRVCKELDFDCANCMGQALIGHLNWYINLLEWSIEQDKKPRKS